MGQDKKEIAFFERGSWYHRIKTLKDDYTTSYSKKGGFKTKEEAEESFYKCEEEYQKQLSIHHLNIDKDVTVSNYLIYWFENIFKNRNPENTYALGVAYVVYNLLVPFFRQNDSKGDIKLKLVNATFFDSVLEEVSKSSASAGNKSREVLNIAMQDAFSDKYISYNPIKETKIYKRKKPKITILTKAQIKDLLQATKYDNWYLEILLALFCGLRKGEIVGLKFQDLDLDNGIIRIRRQLVRDPILAKEQNEVSVKVDEYVLVEKPPKKDSYRNLRLPKVVLEELKKRKSEYDSCIANNKDNEDFEILDYVCFNRKTGKPQLPSSFNGYLYRVCPKNNLPNISVHGLRHMFATILIERGVPLAKIAALLGHSSPNTTFEIYCGIMDERAKILSFINTTFNKNIIDNNIVQDKNKYKNAIESNIEIYLEDNSYDRSFETCKVH